MRVWLSALIVLRRPGVIAVRIDHAQKHPSGEPIDRAFTAADFERIHEAARAEVDEAFLAGEAGACSMWTTLVLDLHEAEGRYSYADSLDR